ncbi:MAG TPA: DUF2207 domain-containing protein, partial [Longimicrobiales bacterium]|nr:DUF2207 domain-containing protein [Longimicrobiales bacterium]
MKRPRTHHLAAALAVLSLATLTPADAVAQGESLTWDSIHVRARLDEDARLHVREHQSIVFDGAWNGGERELEPRLGQKVNLEGIWRMDTGTGELIPLDQEDDAERVDTYDQDGSTVRWRSRDPDDPPFSHERLDYVLEYSVTNAVIPRPDGYLLDYDFLFTDRDGPVDRFTLELELADAWTPQAQVQSRWDAVAIPPGNGFKLEIPLTYADGRPATVLPPTSPLLRYLAMGILVLGAALLLRRLNTREREAGRFRPLPEVEGDDWLEANVFRMSPELVGAAWDRSTGADEVAGLLARLVQEGKLSSRTEPGSGLGKQPVLHLALKVPRTDFRGYERELIDALFFDDRTETDTESIKEHYESSGFHPGQIIGPELKRKVDALAGGGRVSRSWRAALILLGAGGALFVAAGILRPADLLPGVVAVAFLGVAGVIATT